MFSHHVHTLKSGLNVILVPMPAVESATVMVFANTGSRYETPNQEGIAHFFEHMVFKGTDKYPQPQLLAAAIDSVGADFNAFTSKEFTGYYVKAASGHVDLALEVLSDMLLTPKLRQDDIDREKNVIIEEIRMYLDNPARHIGNLFENMMYGGSGLGHDIIGSEKTVSNLKTADFEQFLQQWYGLANLVVVVAGDAKVIDSPETIKKIEHYFSKETKPRVQNKVSVKTYFSSNPISSNRVHIENKKTEQAHFILGFPAFSRQDKRKTALSVLSVLLGGNMSSRLFTEIREKRGLCYYVHSDADLYHDTGFFGASAGVDTTRVHEAIDAMIGEFVGLVDGSKPVTEEELNRAKEYLLGKTVLGFEDSESVAQFYGMRHLLLDEIETPDELQARIKAVTMEDVMQVAHALIKLPELRFGIIGPYKDSAPFIETIEKRRSV